MEIKHYEKPELEVVELTEADVLAVSADAEWGGTTDTNYGGYPWLDN